MFVKNEQGCGAHANSIPGILLKKVVSIWVNDMFVYVLSSKPTAVYSFSTIATKSVHS